MKISIKHPFILRELLGYGGLNNILVEFLAEILLCNYFNKTTEAIKYSVKDLEYKPIEVDKYGRVILEISGDAVERSSWSFLDKD